MRGLRVHGMRLEDVVGGEVRRPFRIFGEVVQVGSKLSREQVAQIPTTNRRALIENGFIVAFGEPKTEAPSVIALMERSDGLYDVIQGHIANDEPLTFEAAQAVLGAGGPAVGAPVQPPELPGPEYGDSDPLPIGDSATPAQDTAPLAPQPTKRAHRAKSGPKASK